MSELLYDNTLLSYNAKSIKINDVKQAICAISKAVQVLPVFPAPNQEQFY